MGQAWCKEKSSKAQDSKSPLDRVFVRCAHRIYPSLKEEGSVLGGATQRVTSSEIGYAGSPPREVLTRGRSIDSVDRPFHPNEWVDVNLEVPSTPRASSVLTNLTVDTSLYPATTPTSSCSNLKDVTPVPPPRRRKKNRGRPLPPKPDEALENSSSNLKHVDVNAEPLYSSVKSPKTSGDEQESEDEIRTGRACSSNEEPKHEGRRIKEIYEHKVNGTGKIISSDVVSGKRTYTSEDRKSWGISEPSHHHKKVHENEEYERFARNQSAKDASTPNHQEKRKPKDLERQMKYPSRDTGKSEGKGRTKNYSTVSLPNYDELDISRHPTKSTRDEGPGGEKTKPRRPVRSSTGSLPAESFLSPFSEKTSVRLEDYIPRHDSNENVPSYQVLRKLDCSENGVVEGAFVKYDSSKLEDWELGDISNCDLTHHRRLSSESPSPSGINDEKGASNGEDVVDFSQNTQIRNDEREFSIEREIPRRGDTESPVSLQKPEAFGKTPSPVLGDNENLKSSKDRDDAILEENRPHLRYFNPPTLEENCRASSTCDSVCSPVSKKPFFLDEEKNASVSDTIGESRRNGGIAVGLDRSEQSRMIFGRSLSNESEPYEDAYESKELRGHHAATRNLIRTISEESLPREMLENAERDLDDFFDEKLAKDVRNKLRKECVDQKATVKTPPPSPEPRIKPEILDNDHSALLKVLKDEAAEESNLSSMTPSLTELEAALSDMLEKEDSHEERTAKHEDKVRDDGSTFKLIEPDIVPVEKNTAGLKAAPGSIVEASARIETQGRTSDRSLVDEDFEERIDGQPVSLGQILEERKPVTKGRKVSFCAWEESRMAEIDLRDDREFIGRADDFEKMTAPEQSTARLVHSSDETDVSRISPSHEPIEDDLKDVACHAPEKPSRLYLEPEDLAENIESIPTPPRRKNKGSLGAARKDLEGTQNGSAITDSCPNDRLI